MFTVKTLGRSIYLVKNANISFVAITHSCPDFHALGFVKSSIPILVPKGAASSLKKTFTNPIIEIENEKEHFLTGDIKVTAFEMGGFKLPSFLSRYVKKCGYQITGVGESLFVPQEDKALREYYERFKQN